MGTGEHPINERYRAADSTAGTSHTWRKNLGIFRSFIIRVMDGTTVCLPMLLGYLVEVVSGVPFEEFLKTRILNPLGMHDTAFSVPDEKADRYATLYEPTEDGGIQVLENAPVASGPLSFFHSGGADCYRPPRLPPFLPDVAQRWRTRWRATPRKKNR